MPLSRNRYSSCTAVREGLALSFVRKLTSGLTVKPSACRLTMRSVTTLWVSTPLKKTTPFSMVTAPSENFSSEAGMSTSSGRYLQRPVRIASRIDAKLGWSRPMLWTLTPMAMLIYASVMMYG